MKKQILLLMAGGVMIMASCNQPAETGMSDAQIDSMVNARVETIRAEMMAQNDSLINVMAIEKADSIIAAMKSGKPAAKKAAAAPKKPQVETVGNGSTQTTTAPATSPNAGKRTSESGTNQGKRDGESGTNRGKRK